MRNKVQTNDHKVNVLVETENSNNSHYSHLNVAVYGVKALTDKEVLKIWKRREKKDELQLAKDWIKKQKGYAVSNCVDETLGIDYSSVVEYKEL